MDLSTPKVMGVLNLTPDSFYSGSRHANNIRLLKQVESMLAAGATFLDVGGYSTRPGADEITEEEERNRVLPAIQTIMKEFPDACISIDTFRSSVARQAVQEGACMVNDIAGGELDGRMFETVASLQVPYIMMHMRGNPKTMTTLTEYSDLIKEVINYFTSKLFQLHQLGVKDIIVDPGFGFAKTREQNFHLLQNLHSLKVLGKPILVGLSRKSMIWKSLNITPEEALNGTTALNSIALQLGTDILRVHDVKEAVEVVNLNQLLSHS